MYDLESEAPGLILTWGNILFSHSKASDANVSIIAIFSSLLKTLVTFIYFLQRIHQFYGAFFVFILLFFNMCGL